MREALLQISGGAVIEKTILSGIIFVLILLASTILGFIRKRFLFSGEESGADVKGRDAVLGAQPATLLGKTARNGFLKDGLFFYGGTTLGLVAVILLSAVIPWGGTLILRGKNITLQLTDIDVGLLYLMGMVSLMILGLAISIARVSVDFFSKNGMQLLVAAGVSQLVMALALVPLSMRDAKMNLKSIIDAQIDSTWNIIIQPLGFLLFFMGTIILLNTLTVLIAVSKTESENNSPKYQWIFLFMDNAFLFLISAVVVSLFWGGYDVPFWDDTKLGSGLQSGGFVLREFVFFLKIGLVIFFFILGKQRAATLNRTLLISWSWKVLVPVAFLNILASAIVEMIK